MKGLVLKDLMTLKRDFKSYLAIFVLYLFIDYQSGQSSLTLAIGFIISTMLPIASISYDERSKWDKIANTMPVSRKEIILAKYALGRMFTVAAVTFSSIISVIMLKEKLAVPIAMTLVSLVYQAVLIPLLYKFGSERGRIMMIAFMALPFAAFALAADFLKIDMSNFYIFIDNNMTVVTVCTVAAVLAIYTVSILVSIRMYEKRDM